MSWDPRRDRLASDEAGLVRLAAESGGSVAIESSRGRSPTGYVVALRCLGIIAADGGLPQYGELHRIEIALGARYPMDAPEVRFLTAIYNPHVHLSGRLCAGKTSMTERLEDLVVRIGRLIQYDPQVMDLKSPALSPAMDLAKSIWSSLPVGHETFRRARAVARPAALTWTDRRSS